MRWNGGRVGVHHWYLTRHITFTVGSAAFVAPWAAIVIGFVAGIVCNYGCKIKEVVGLDDALDVFGVHGVGGVWGAIATGIFAQKWVVALDGTVNPGIFH